MCTVLDETKTEGQVFTPVGIVSMILDSVKYTGKTVLTKSIMEPSFGKGVFLIEIVSRIIHEGKAEGKISRRNPNDSLFSLKYMASKKTRNFMM